MHRDLGCYLLRGLTPRRLFANMLGKATGVTRGRDANLHGTGDLDYNIVGFISHLGHSLSVAVGMAMSFNYRDEPRVALTFIGDGSSSTGVFHEAMNLAAVENAPIVVIVENNLYAYATPMSQQMKIEDIADRAAGYGIPGLIVDGNDVEAVYAVTKQAVDRARAGGGPTLIEAKTMRMLGHAIHDGAEYVPGRTAGRVGSQGSAAPLRGASAGSTASPTRSSWTRSAIAARSRSTTPSSLPSRRRCPIRIDV